MWTGPASCLNRSQSPGRMAQHCSASLPGLCSSGRASPSDWLGLSSWRGSKRFASWSWTTPKVRKGRESVPVAWEHLKPTQMTLLCSCVPPALSHCAVRCWQAVWTWFGGPEHGSTEQASREGRLTQQPGALLQGPVCPPGLCYSPAAAEKRKGSRLTMLEVLNIHHYQYLLFLKDPLCLLQGLTKQYPVTPVVDGELLQMSMRLFRRTMAGKASGPDRPEAAATPAAEAAATAAAATAHSAAVGSGKLSTAQPQVCLSWKWNGSPRYEKRTSSVLIGFGISSLHLF